MAEGVRRPTGFGRTTKDLPPRPQADLPQPAPPEVLAALEVQLRRSQGPTEAALADLGSWGTVQRRGSSDGDASHVHAIAARGVGGSGEALPHLERVQASFGPHDLTGVEAHVGGAAGEAARAIGADAFATGRHVAFASAPDLFLAAHEAAHVVQQRAGVHLKGGVGEAGDEYERNADEVAAAVVRGESAVPLLDRYAPAPVSGRWLQGGPIQRRDGTGPPKRPPNLIAPKKIEFGEVQVGDRAREERILWNDDAGEIAVERVEVGRDRDQRTFRVAEAPSRILPTTSPSAARAGRLVVDFVPGSADLETDVLHLHLAPHHNQPVTHVVPIVLVGRGRAVGARSHAELRHCEDARDDREAKEAADHDAAAARRDRADRNAEISTPYHAGRKAAFDAKINLLASTLDTLDQKRREGVDVVEKEAASYQRATPKAGRSGWDYLVEGAKLALTFGSAGIAAGVASSLQIGGRAITKFIEKSLDRAISKGIPAMIANWTAGDHAAAGAGAATSADPLIEFFSMQRVAIIDSHHARKVEILTTMTHELLPSLRDANEATETLAALDEAVEALGSVSGKAAVDVQAMHTRGQWMSAVSKRSGSTKTMAAHADACGGAPVDERTVSDLDVNQSRRGVLDIHFAADLQRPGTPVRIVDAFVAGVSGMLARQLPQSPLLASQIPVRAIATDVTFGGQRVASPVLTVARNEVGKLDVAAGNVAELADANQEARYLAAKVAPMRAHEQRPEDVEAGGRRLIEQEIAQAWVRSVKVRTDDASNPEE